MKAIYKKILHKITLLLFISSLFFACRKPPVYPETPEIKFESVKTISFTRDEIRYDSLIISVSFKDGDGDIGLEQKDTISPYQRIKEYIYDTTKTDSIIGFIPNFYYFNYHATMYIKKNGVFELFPLPDPNLNYNGRIGSLNKSSRTGPIEGKIDYSGIRIRQRNAPNPLDTIKFKIQIVDRKLNKSNIVETSEIITNL
jgi:hypothetical protein